VSRKRFEMAGLLKRVELYLSESHDHYHRSKREEFRRQYGSCCNFVGQGARWPPINFRILFSPTTDSNFDKASYQEFATGYFLTREAMKWSACTTHPFGEDGQQGPTVRSFESHTPAITQRSFALKRGNREDHEQSPCEFDTESLDHSSLGFGTR
jgi:hypothetical protein